MSQKTPDYSKERQMQAEANKYAADVNRQNTKDTLALQEKQYNQSLQYLTNQDTQRREQADKNVAMYAPGVDSYNNALQQLNSIYANEDSWFNKKFTQDDLQNDAGYQFQLSQGQNALNNSLAARNGVNSGAAQKALAQYSQGLASNEFQNAYNRNMQEKNNRLVALQNLLGQGQFSLSGTQSSRYMTDLGTQQAGLATNYGNTLTNIMNNSASTDAGLALQNAQTNAYYDSLQKQSGGNGLSSALMGGVMGGVTGFFTGGPLGAAAGAGLGALSGYMNGSASGSGQMGNLAGGAVYNYQNSTGPYKGTGYMSALSKV